MALTLGDRQVRPLTADEVLRMVDAGIISEDEPVELLDGVLTEVSAKSPEHETVKMRLNGWLAAGAAAGRYAVRVEAPIAVPDPTSLPEPDIAVVAGGGNPHRHPTTAMLVVEVAASSLRFDTRVKPAFYAAAGIPELWVVDVAGLRLHRFTRPEPDGYAERAVAERDAVVQPVALPAAPLALADLFSGL